MSKLFANVKTEGLIQEVIVSRTDNMTTKEIHDYAVDLERTHVRRTNTLSDPVVTDGIMAG